MCIVAPHSLSAARVVNGCFPVRRNYVHLKRPSALTSGYNFYLFKEGEGHVPMWESYPNGGCWILKISKKQTQVVGKMWQDLLIAAIGEQFEEPDVCGITLALRQQYSLLSVWNVDNTNDEIRFMIGEKLKKILDLDSNTLVEYKAHNVSIQDGSTFKNATAYVFAATAQK